jgi:signal transduction histidine kinase
MRNTATKKNLRPFESDIDYKNLIESLPDIVYKIDSEGFFTYVNGSVRSLGYSPKDLIGRHFSAIIHPGDVGRISRGSILPVLTKGPSGRKCRPQFFDERRTGERMTKKLEVRLIKKEKRGVKKEVRASVYAFGDIRHVAKKGFAGTIGIIRDITGFKQAEQELHNLSGGILSAQEEERKRLAAELHDVLGQSLLAAKLKLQMLSIKAENKMPIDDTLAEIVGDFSSLIEELRNITMGLRPSFLEDMSLNDILNWWRKRFNDLSGVKIESDAGEMPAVDLKAKENVFRILQEALNNISKHSRADAVKITMKKKGKTLLLSIRDNGRGFNIKNINGNSKSLGLTTMRERAKLLNGICRIDSASGVGTCVYVEVPLK